jgi:hypothetical protein
MFKKSEIESFFADETQGNHSTQEAIEEGLSIVDDLGERIPAINGMGAAKLRPGIHVPEVWRDNPTRYFNGKKPSTETNKQFLARVRTTGEGSKFFAKRTGKNDIK